MSRKKWEVPVTWQEKGLITVYAENEAEAIQITFRRLAEAQEGALMPVFVPGSMNMTGAPVPVDYRPTFKSTVPVVIDQVMSMSEGESQTLCAVFPDGYNSDIRILATKDQLDISMILYDPNGVEVVNQIEQTLEGLHTIIYCGTEYHTLVNTWD